MEASDSWAEQQDHEKFKQWMQNAGWSISTSTDPFEIVALLETATDNTDFDYLSED